MIYRLYLLHTGQSGKSVTGLSTTPVINWQHVNWLNEKENNNNNKTKENQYPV